MDTALKVCGIETKIDGIRSITQCSDQHIHTKVCIGFFCRRLGFFRLSNLGFGNFRLSFLRNCFIHKCNLVTVGEEAVGNRNNTVCHRCSTAGVGIGIAGAVLSTDKRSLAQVNSLIQLAFQADIGNSNVVSVVGYAVFQHGIPSRSAQYSKADTGQLTVNQILAQIQLHSVASCGNFNSISVIIDIAFKVIGIETDADRFIVAAQSADIHIQLQVGSNLVESNLIAVSEETVGNCNHTVCQGCGAASIGVGITGTVLTAGNGSKVQINRPIFGTFQTQVRDCNVVSVSAAIR